MRILFWTGLYPPHIGGLEVFGQQLVQALHQRGHEIIVVAAHKMLPIPDRTEDNGVPIYRYHFQSVLESRDMAAIMSLCGEIAQLKRTFRPDIVHLHPTDHSVFFHSRTLKAHLCPTLFTVHSAAAFSAEANSLLGRMLRAADRVSTVSTAMLDDALAAAPEIASRASVVLNGLQLPEIAPSSLSFDPPTFIMVGRVVPEKGFHVALDAFAELLIEFPTARLRLAGDGDALPTLKTQALRLGIFDRVDWLGWITPESIPQLINDASLVLMPSRWREPFGLVALQTAQMARPIVATRVGGIPEIVVDGETGLLVEPEDSGALAQAAAAIIRDPAAAERMGSAARARAESVFSFERMVNEYEHLYRQLAQGQQ